MQQLRRFQAATMGEAYARVRDELGDDAVIVSTRSASAPGLLGGEREFVEVVAGATEAAAAAPPSPSPVAERPDAAPVPPAGPGDSQEPGEPGESSKAEPELAPPFVNPMAGADGPFGVDGRVPEPAPPGPDAAEPAVESALAPAPRPVPRSAPGGDPTIDGIAAQIGELRGIVERISMASVDERVDGGSRALQDARSRLIDQGVGPAVLIPVLDEVAAATVADATPQTVLQTLERKLAAKLPAVAAIEIGRRPLAIFIVGPGGSGKTAVAVRLAMELATARGARVTLAGVDVNRAGAPQALTACGAATGLPVRLCYAPGELKALLADGSADVVIVDTPANDGARRDRMTELGAFTAVAQKRTTLLVLPATTKGEDVGRTAAALAGVGIDGLVLTRCDETQSFGALLTAACEQGIGIAYTAHAEGIGDPLRVGDNHALALAIVSGRWPQVADVTAPALAG